MKCPACDSEMSRGRIRVRGTLIGFLFVGMSHQHLYFEHRPAEEGKNKADERVLYSGHGKKAYRCPECEMLISPGLLDYAT